MNAVKVFLRKIGLLLLSIVRILRKAICCRRKKEPEYLLPMTLEDVTINDENKISNLYEQWDAWPTVPTSSSQSCEIQKENELTSDDFFKDMVPQIRKPKKIYIMKDDEKEKERTPNRLAMDPKAVLSGPDLGIIEDNPSNWEDVENSELWDPDQLIRETKRIEREKRLAEHQRRKQEKEIRRASKQESANTKLSFSDSTDKPKFS